MVCPLVGKYGMPTCRKSVVCPLVINGGEYLGGKNPTVCDPRLYQAWDCE